MDNKRKVIGFLGTKGGIAVLTAAIYIAYFAVALILAAVMNISENAFFVCAAIFLFPLAVAFTVEGWRALSVITPKIFLIMPIIGWVIYFSIKLTLASIVGEFVGPYRWAKKISNRIASSQID